MDPIEIFKRIEDRIALKYIPGWIAWSDKTFDGAWSKAFERINRVLTEKPANMIDELKRYEQTCMNLLNEYFKSDARWESVEFLDSIRLTPGQLAERKEVGEIEIDYDDWFTKIMQGVS